MTWLAHETGLTREGLYKALSPDGNPEFSTVIKVIKALDLKFHIKWINLPDAPICASSNTCIENQGQILNEENKPSNIIDSGFPGF